MDNAHIRRHGHQPTGKPPSPRLLRSRSGAPAMSLPETHAFVSNPSQRLANNRSISTTKSRTNSTDENMNPSTMVSSLQKKPCSEKKEGFATFLQRPSHRGGCDGAKKPRMVSSSPSAWALSPGRSTKMEAQPQPPKAKMGGGGGGGVSGVFKYFRQKKVCPVREEEFHRFRVLHNTLVQWRLVNARAEAAMATTKIVAEDKLFSVWLRILKMRNSIVEERIELQRVKHGMKLLQIVKPEMSILNEWAKIEKKNYEAVGKLVTKLWAQATRLPLLEGAKGDVVGVYNAMRMAVGVMESIEAMLSAFFSQAEKTVDLLQQLVTTLQQHNKWSQELQKTIPMYASLQASELSLRAHLIQAAMATPREVKAIPWLQFL